MAKVPRDPARLYDERLAKSYIDKAAKGEKATRAEHYAYKRIKRDRDRAARLEAFDSITQAEWKEWSGRQAKIINEQGRRYGAPFAAAKFSARALARWLHDFLADRHDQLNRPIQAPVQDEIANEQLRKLRRENAVAEGRLVDVEEEREGLDVLARLIRDLGETLQKQFGRDAGQLVDETLDEWVRVCEQRFGEQNAQSTEESSGRKVG